MRTMLHMSVSKDDILALSVPERIQLVEEIWDSIATEPETVPLTGAQRKELDRRKREHRLDPSAPKTWPEVRARHERRRK
jgi:putative addiction module component (TIGR02574 family)